MRKQFMPIVGAALLAGALAIVGCVSVESTRAQLASSNPQEVQKAKETIRRIVVEGRTPAGNQVSEMTQLEFVGLVSDNELLFRIIHGVDGLRDKTIIKAASERIDLSKPDVGLEILENYPSGLMKIGDDFAEKVVATLSESELLKALDRRYDNYSYGSYGYRFDEFYVPKIVKRLLGVTRKPEVLCKALEFLKDRNRDSRFDIGEHLVNTTQDVSLLLSLCEGGKNANLIPEGAFKKEIFLKLAGMPEKLPDTAVLNVLDATDSAYKPIVKDAALRKRLIARLPEKDAVKFALEDLEYFSAELDLPFAAVATDLMSGEEIILRNGDVYSAIRASMSIPGVFSPVERDGKVLVDGGLVNSLPIEVCRQLGADKVIAVDLNCRGQDEPIKAYGALNMFPIIDETFRVVMNIAQKRYFPMPMPDIVLQPPVGDISILDFHKADTLVNIGYEYTIMEWQRFIGATDDCTVLI